MKIHLSMLQKILKKKNLKNNNLSNLAYWQPVKSNWTNQQNQDWCIISQKIVFWADTVVFHC